MRSDLFFLSRIDLHMGSQHIIVNIQGMQFITYVLSAAIIGLLVLLTDALGVISKAKKNIVNILTVTMKHG